MRELVCFRAAAYRTPIRSRDHSTGGAGRYHRSDSPATQYFCLHPLGPWAEVVRNQRCRTLEEALEARVPAWAIRLRLDDDPLVIDFDAAARGAIPHPIDPAALVSDDQDVCRDLAQAHRDDPASPQAVRVPSAALPGTEKLVIFGPRRGIEYAAAPRRGVQIPCAPAAVDGRMARGLFELIRLRGEPHAGFDAWRVGGRHELPAIDAL